MRQPEGHSEPQKFDLHDSASHLPSPKNPDSLMATRPNKDNAFRAGPL